MDFSFFSKLSSLGNLLSRPLFSSSSASVVGIDIGSSAIKVVQLKKKGGVVVLETYGSLSLGPYAGVEPGRAAVLPVDKLSTAVEDLFREANITTRSGAISVPLTSSLISMVSMPALEESRMAEMVPLEARRYIPVPISEVSLDWWVIPKQESEMGTDAAAKASGKVDVLLVAILNDVLSKYQNIVRNLKLKDSFLEIELFSTVRAVLDQGIKPVMVLDFGASTTKLYLVEHGLVRDSHTINRGSQDITLAISRGLGITPTRGEELKRTLGVSSASGDTAEAKQVSEATRLVLDAVFAEARRILLLFEKQQNKSVGTIMVSGGGSALKGFAEVLKGRFPDAEIIFADPFAKTQTPAFLGKTLKSLGPEFAVAIGLALRKLNQFA